MNDLIRFYHDELGFWLHPLRPDSKVPKFSGWNAAERFGAAALEKEYDQTPGMNLGVRLGKPVKGGILYCFDLDIKTDDKVLRGQAERLLKKILGADFDRAVKVESGRGNGSSHYYFLSDRKLRSKKLAVSDTRVKVHSPSSPVSKVDKKHLSAEEIKSGLRYRNAFEIEFLGEGKQAVLPPSIHPDTGRAYQCAGDNWVLEKFDESLLSENGLEKVSSLSVVRDPVPEFEKFEDLDFVLIDDRIRELIKTGEGIDADYAGDRSSALMAVLAELAFKTDLSKAQIMSIVCDPENAISEAGLSRRGSIRGACEWVWPQIEKAFKQHRAEFVFDDDLEVEADDTKKWLSGLERYETGNIKKTLMNLNLIVLNDPEIKGCFRFNRFSKLVEIARGGAWVQHLTKSVPIPGVLDEDAVLTALRLYVGFTYRVEFSAVTILDVLTEAAHRDSFHPIEDALRALKWDGVKRIDRWVCDYLGAENNALNRQIGRKFLIAMVRRILTPGCKFDSMLVLEGPQGAGKSLSLQILAGSIDHTVSLTDFKDRKAMVEKTEAAWIVELEEMHASRKAEADDLKQFISCQVDVVRKAYARLAKHYRRQFVIVGTTNETQYLRDVTGARRFWPIWVGEIDLKGLKKVRDQLLAEAAVYEKTGESLVLPSRLWEHQAAAADERFEVDEREALVCQWLAQREENFESVKQIDAVEVWEQALGQMGREFRRGDQQAVGAILRRLGYGRERVYKNGARIRVWVKK